MNRATAAEGLGPEEAAILRARTRALAQEPPRAIDADEMMTVIEFELAGERYAFPLAFVKGVSLLRELTPVPCTPSFVLGIINLRGGLLTVIDLKTFFGLPNAGLTELNKIVLLQHGAMELGVLADVVHGVRRLRLEELHPVPLTLTGVGADYARGITTDQLIVLAPEVILADERLLIDEDVASEAK
ncbi:MAG TPA: chemotaxis protein CheW [Chthoniobacteraceae bacterium]|jgi:purine-binding chemotaxis protein CheW|nr:chemotaxis protein CheW [Chthoniobacteraceae bacterium]